MKFYITILFFCSPFFLLAQEYSSVFDSIAKSEQNEYILKYHKQLNIKFDISNDVNNYYIPYEGTSANFVPNINIRYGLDFSYKFVSIRLGIRPKVSDKSKEDKGESDNFRMKIKFLFNSWSHLLEYNLIKGYYVKNSDAILDLDDLESGYVQFPDLKTNIISGTSAYKFNKNYSVRAIQSQTEIQIKSAGTFMPSIDYWFYQIDGLKKTIYPNGEIVLRENYNAFQGVNLILNAGYYYTYVYKKNWYASAYAIPGLGMDFYEETRYFQDSSSDRNISEIVLSFQTGVAIGYSSDRYFFGLAGGNRTTNEKFSTEEIQFHTSKNTFHIFLGYRFKAPKTISKPIDTIEKKVPLLNIENSNN